MMKALLGKGVLAVWNDIAPELEAEYNDWYTNQHLPERVGIEGFLRGRRFRRVSEGGPRYFTLYEVENTDVLKSAPYMERLNTPTDWTKKVAPQFQNSTRTACSVTTSVGRGIGGYATTIEVGAAAGPSCGRGWSTTCCPSSSRSRRSSRRTSANPTSRRRLRRTPQPSRRR
jgi:hypothetical protein